MSCLFLRVQLHISDGMNTRTFNLLNNVYVASKNFIILNYYVAELAWASINFSLSVRL